MLHNLLQSLRSFINSYTPAALAIGAGSLALAAVAGGLAAVALGTASADPPRTVTVNVATGPTGPSGPPGPAGVAGPTGPQGTAGLDCPVGYSPGYLVINHPGGQTRIFTCLQD